MLEFIKNLFIYLILFGFVHCQAASTSPGKIFLKEVQADLIKLRDRLLIFEASNLPEYFLPNKVFLCSQGQVEGFFEKNAKNSDESRVSIDRGGVKFYDLLFEYQQDGLYSLSVPKDKEVANGLNMPTILTKKNLMIATENDNATLSIWNLKKAYAGKSQQFLVGPSMQELVDYGDNYLEFASGKAWLGCFKGEVGVPCKIEDLHWNNEGNGFSVYCQDGRLMHFKEVSDLHIRFIIWLACIIKDIVEVAYSKFVDTMRLNLDKINQSNVSLQERTEAIEALKARYLGDMRKMRETVKAYFLNVLVKEVAGSSVWEDIQEQFGEHAQIFILKSFSSEEYEYEIVQMSAEAIAKISSENGVVLVASTEHASNSDAE